MLKRQSILMMTKDSKIILNKSVQFLEKRMGQEVEGDSLGDEYKGYVFRITGGNDKDGDGEGNAENMEEFNMGHRG